MSAVTEDGATTTRGAAPLLRVLRGRPDDTEVAALVAVVAARLRAPAAASPQGPVSRWSDPAHRLGASVPAPDAWRTSGWAGR